MALFTGIRDRRIDNKDRIVIPAPIVAAIQAESQGHVFLVPGAEMPCLEAYPARKFEQMAADHAPDRFKGGQQARRVFFQSAEQVEIKGPGRISIPKRWIEKYFGGGEVRVAGMADYLELWDPSEWERSVGDALSDGAGSQGK